MYSKYSKPVLRNVSIHILYKFFDWYYSYLYLQNTCTASTLIWYWETSQRLVSITHIHILYKFFDWYYSYSYSSKHMYSKYSKPVLERRLNEYYLYSYCVFLKTHVQQVFGKPVLRDVSTLSEHELSSVAINRPTRRTSSIGLFESPHHHGIPPNCIFSNCIFQTVFFKLYFSKHQI